MNQAVPRTTPSRRRVTRHGLVHNGWGVGRHCGRLAGGALVLRKRRCKKESKHSTANATPRNDARKERPPPKTREPPENKTQNTRTPNRETATRPKEKPRNKTLSRVSGPEKTENRRNRTPTGRALRTSMMKMNGSSH